MTLKKPYVHSALYFNLDLVYIWIIYIWEMTTFASPACSAHSNYQECKQISKLASDSSGRHGSWKFQLLYWKKRKMQKIGVGTKFQFQVFLRVTDDFRNDLPIRKFLKCKPIVTTTNPLQTYPKAINNQNSYFCNSCLQKDEK